MTEYGEPDRLDETRQTPVPAEAHPDGLLDTQDARDLYAESELRRRSERTQKTLERLRRSIN